MHKVDADGATAGNEFTDGVPTITEATNLAAKWHNAVQRELVAVVEGAGLVLSDADDNQVLDALTILYGRLAAANTWALLQTLSKGLTATGDTNAVAVTGTGNGTGAGGAFTGGATGPGLTATAGGVNANGGTFAGGATAGKALEVTAGAYGAYIRAAIGLNVVASNGVGAEITGAASAVGAVLTGGTGALGAQIAAGTAATATDPTNAAELANGNLLLSGTAPNSDESIPKTITPANILNVRATIEPHATTPVLRDGAHVTSVATSGANVLRITFASSFANDEYTVTVGSNNSGYQVHVAAVNVAYVEIAATAAGVAAPIGTSYAGSAATRLYVHISGRQ
jgi:hypothetical protein